MIEIKNVYKSYDGIKNALDDVNLTINNGSIFALIGHNGAGKTTLIKAIMGIHELSSGSIMIDGKSISSNMVECKMKMAYVADVPTLYENLRAIDFINFVCDMYDTSVSVRRDNILKYSKIFELEDKLSSELSSFSHGMKQKVAIIAALSHDPSIIIMDEPFVGLDPKAVFDIKNIMFELAKDGKLIIFSTHILDVAEKLCDSVAIIKDGKIVANGSMKQIKGDVSLEEVFLELGE